MDPIFGPADTESLVEEVLEFPGGLVGDASLLRSVDGVVHWLEDGQEPDQAESLRDDAVQIAMPFSKYELQFGRLFVERAYEIALRFLRPALPSIAPVRTACRRHRHDSQ